ncbi:MAG: response regulator [Anaerolineales bacterium]|nr:response regulator [Anaerolineales bacterium]MCB8954755.1 response regulator [Ardenticatenales bacterium]
MMTSAPKRVLCVEDNPTNLLLISRIVEAENMELLIAADGHAARELLTREIPDVILMDINIPGISGLDLTRMIREDEAISHIPIIATTANVLVGDRERCIEAGCNDYMPKPLDIRRVRSLLRYYTNARQ